LLDWVVGGIEARGGEVLRLRVADLDVHPCTGCDGCMDTGECVIRDDMDRVIDLVFSCHHLIVATPVYFYHVPAQLKALIDRFQPLWVRRDLLGLKPAKRGKLLLVASGATEGRDLFQCVLTTLKCVSPSLGLDMSPSHLLVRGVDKPGEVLKIEGLREEALNIGRSIPLSISKG